MHAVGKLAGGGGVQPTWSMAHQWNPHELAMALRAYVWDGQLHPREAAAALGTVRLRPDTSTARAAVHELNSSLVLRLLYQLAVDPKVIADELRDAWPNAAAGAASPFPGRARTRSPRRGADEEGGRPSTETAADAGTDDASACGTEDAEHYEPDTAAAADSERGAEGTGAAAAADAECTMRVPDGSDEESSELTPSSTPGIEAAELAAAARITAAPQRPRPKAKGRRVRRAAARGAAKTLQNRSAAMSQYNAFVKQHAPCLQKAGIPWGDVLKAVSRMWRMHQASETGHPNGCPKCLWKGCSSCGRYPRAPQDT